MDENKNIRKMIFIYNALNDGWTVRKLDNNKYELLKDTENIKKEVILEDCIKKYIDYNFS